MELIVRRRYPRGLSRPKDETSAEWKDPEWLGSVHGVQVPRLASAGQNGSPRSDPPIAGLGAVRARKTPGWRRAAWLASVLAGTLGCGHGSELTGPDIVPNAERKEHRAIQKGRLTEPQQPSPMRIAEIIALPRFPQAYTRAQLDEITAIESRGAVVVGYVARLLQMGDGDYHIQITAVAPGRCLGSDTPDQLITELTPGVRSRRPNYTWEALVPLCGAATQIRLTGWLFYDSPHQDDVGRSTPWEVHPVTRIEVCCWRELG
jgi:hypothetical protein